MSQTNIEIRETFNDDELFNYIPQSVYYKNNVLQSTRSNRLAPTTAVKEFIPNNVASFTIAPTTTAFIDLCDIDLCMSVESNTIAATSEQIIIGNYPILSAINSIKISLDGCVIYSGVPSLMKNNNTLFKYKWSDIQNGNLSLCGLFPHSEAVTSLTGLTAEIGEDKEIKVTTAQATGAANPFTFTTGAGNRTEVTLSANQVNINTVSPYGYTDLQKCPCVAYDTTNHKINLIQFYKLSDLLSFDQSLVPVYGREIQIEISFESAGYLDINTNKTTPFTISKFNQFYIRYNTVSINTTEQNKLKKIYSKPISQPYRVCETILNQIGTYTKNTELQINLNVNTNYDTQAIIIGFINSTSNNQAYTLVDVPNNQNVCRHTQFNYRFIPLSRVEVLANDQTLYQRSFNTEIFDYANSSDLLKILYKRAASVGDVNGLKINNFIQMYLSYLDCCYEFGKKPEDIIPFNYFIYNYCCLCIPMSSFSSLNSQSSISVRLEFGDSCVGTSLAAGTDYCPEMRKAGDTTKLNTLLTTVYSNRVIRYEPNKVSTMTIGQSFQNDLTITSETNAE